MDLPLTAQRCVPCEGGTPPLTADRAKTLHAELPSGWILSDTSLVKRFTFSSFRDAIAFVQHAADLAESEGHHPNLNIEYRTVTVTLTTHAIHGLSDNDFILAAKLEPLVKSG